MTEVPIEVGYRSYITLLRNKWNIVYHGKDLYFSHANKILEPYYDVYTKEFYGVETNPTRLAIVKFLDQFHEGPGIYEPNSFKDLLKHTVLYENRKKWRKPFRVSRHQESHPSLMQAALREQYQDQDTIPTVRECKERPYMATYIVEDHPNEAMIGRVWTHMYIPSPVDFSARDDFKKGTGYSSWLLQACTEGHDVIIVEPVTTQFYASLVLRIFWWLNQIVKAMYIMSIFKCCQHPHDMAKNFTRFLGISFGHLILSACMKIHPLGKYKLPDRFHDVAALSELKYFREILPVITTKNVVLFKDQKGQVKERRRALNLLHFINLFVLVYNYMFGINYWKVYRRV